MRNTEEQSDWAVACSTTHKAVIKRKKRGFMINKKTLDRRQICSCSFEGIDSYINTAELPVDLTMCSTSALPVHRRN